MAALPFCRVRLRAEKPKSSSYPREVKSLGDHLRKSRLDLGLLQKNVAAEMGVDLKTLVNWERQRTQPKIRFLPLVFRFLGGDPRLLPAIFPERRQDGTGTLPGGTGSPPVGASSRRRFGEELSGIPPAQPNGPLGPRGKRNMIKSMLSVLVGAMVAVGAAAPTASKAMTKSTAVTCTLIGKTVSERYCKQKDGKLYCALAKKTIDTRCCKPAVQ